MSFDIGYHVLAHDPLEGWRSLPGKAFLCEVDSRSTGGSEVLLGLSGSRGVMRKQDMQQRSAEAETYIGYKRVRAGDLVCNKMQARNGLFGISQYEGIISPDYAIYQLNGVHNPRFIEYAVRTELYAAEFASRSNGIGSGFMRLNPDEFLSVRFWLPSREVQDALVECLNVQTAHIDSLMEKKGRFISLLREKRWALIARAVTSGLDPNAPMNNSGVKWLGDVPRSWKVTPLKYLCRVRTGNRDTAHAVPGGGYPFFVRSQTIEEIDSYSADCEAILTAGDGAGVGKVYHYFNGKFDFHQRVYMLSQFEGIRGRYVFYYLSALFAAVALDGGAKSTVDSLRMPVFMGFAVAYPSLPEQDRILDFVDRQVLRIDELIAKTERSIELLKEHRSAVIAAAVTGKIDLRGHANQNMKAAA